MPGSGCGTPATPILTVVVGSPAQAGQQGCDLAEWTAPWGESYRMCRDASTAIPITRADIHELRIEDRNYGDQTWYLVSARFTGDFYRRIEGLGVPNEGEKPYAVLANGKVSVVTPGIAILDHRSLLAASQDLARAEAFASMWGAPVYRVITDEIALQPVRSVSLIQLIAAPSIGWASASRCRAISGVT